MPKLDATVSIKMTGDGLSSPTISSPTCSTDGAIAFTVVVPRGTSVKLEIRNPKEDGGA